VRGDIVAYIVQVIEKVLNESAGDVDGAPLGEGGINLDSLSLLELSLHIERQYHVKFSEDELDAIGGLTIGGLADLVEQKVAAAAGGTR